MNTERSQLVITFKDNHGDNCNITIANPRYDVEESAIKAIAEHIIANNYFKTSQGGDFVEMVKAKVVVSETENFDLVI